MPMNALRKTRKQQRKARHEAIKLRKKGEKDTKRTARRKALKQGAK